jgi:hypothetical protein
VLEFGGTGNAPGQFSGVWGLSTDSTGRVYVADSGNARVQVFTADGTYQSEWSGFVKPTGVFVDAQDEIYVCDSLAGDQGVFEQPKTTCSGPYGTASPGRRLSSIVFAMREQGIMQDICGGGLAEAFGQALDDLVSTCNNFHPEG